MAASDARPVPRKNVAYRAYFPIHDTAGALITGATGLDSEVSIDGAAFADATAEATEIGASGTYFLDLTAAEFNGDGVIVVVKTTSVNAIIPVLVFAPESLGDYRVDTTAEIAAIIAGILTTPGQTIDTTVAGEVTIDPTQLTALVTAIATALLITPANKLLTDAAGRVELQADGLDQIVVETGINARQALAIVGAALAGVLSGAGTTSVTIQALNNPGTPRITATVTLPGDRVTVVLTPPV